MEKSAFTRDYLVFCETLRQTRKSAGLTQVELAQRLGQSQSFVTKIETGYTRVDIVQLRRICEVLGTTLPAFVRRFEKHLAEG
jgi:transcriptional regulator with XRE-family HTH domain